ncbi:GatB/YqeY domain-containing protein [Pseudomonas sp. CFBP 13719]|uniref:GatB/YqeY domain-containing protein n=1 Tax=Pseudomonas sp. CFBP 13719 TaxID=2775303 RepID=UPI001786B534|nr:GatB/YqeY domain-containing protein [Pseudomonas sp. CFBP 13719]MBD8614946.1 GatB/YqeY domain-containing protein [Pseudomonas putida]MBD8681369.1 GatB/YqeY domain-containing protein [Pseudomonas sp. CFBP 13719]
MSLFQEVQAQRQTLRKDPAQVAGFNILTLLVGELETASKRDGSQITDEKVVSVAKKLIKSNEETLRLTSGAGATKLDAENVVLRTLLPQELSEDQLLKILVDAKPGNIGEAMKHLNGQFAGQFDKGLASRVAKQFLS